MDVDIFDAHHSLIQACGLEQILALLPIVHAAEVSCKSYTTFKEPRGIAYCRDFL